MEGNITEHTQKSLLYSIFATPEYYSTPDELNITQQINKISLMHLPF